MNKEFKRVGIKDIKEKRWFLQETLGSVPYLSGMTLAELEAVIKSLQELPDQHFSQQESLSPVR